MNYDEMTAGDLAEQYLMYKDLKSQLTRKFEQKEAALNAELEAITRRMMSLCNEQDATSIKTASGTIIRTLKTRYDQKDWDSMYEFILENNAPYLLQKRIAETAMKEFLDSNPDLLPKGLNIHSEYQISVRKPSK